MGVLVAWKDPYTSNTFRAPEAFIEVRGVKHLACKILKGLGVQGWGEQGHPRIWGAEPYWDIH